MTLWILLFLGLLAAFLVFFVIVAKKGRNLRRNQPLPPPARSALLEQTTQASKLKFEISPPFYLGSNSENDIVVQGAKADYEVCIFYHNSRFAIQALDGAGEVQVNGEELIAGYLWNGDSIKVGGEIFVFRCY